MNAGAGTTSAPPRQRADKWLWFARVVKTRALAAKLVSSGHVRLNGRRMDDPGRGLLIGDVLTIAQARDVRVMKIAAFGERRGPAPEAQLLYEELTPPRHATQGEAPESGPDLAKR